MNKEQAYTEKDQKKYAFIRLLSLMGRHNKACEKLGIDRTLPHYWASVDPDFARAFDDARIQAKKVLQTAHEEALNDRAIDGTEKPITYKGEVTGHYKEHDTTAGIFMLKGLDPATYRDNYKIQVDASEAVRNIFDEITAGRDSKQC